MKIVFSFIVIMIAAASQLVSQPFWEYVDTPNDPEVWDIIAAPNGDLYACGTGIYKSTDNGNSWFGVNKVSYMGMDFYFDDLPIMFASLAATSNDNIFVGLGDGLAFRSTNGGETWEAMDEKLQNVASMAVDIEGKLFVEDGERILYTDDNGDTWDEVPGIDEDFSALNQLKFDDDGNLYVTSYEKIYILSPESNTFEMHNEGIPAETSVECIEFSEDYTYAGTNEGVLHSTDAGLTWQKLSTELDEYDIINLTYHKNILYACTREHGMMQSTDLGMTWSDDSPELPDQRAYKLFVHGSDMFFATIGLYHTTDGENWTKKNGGLGHPLAFVDRNPDGDYFCLTQGGLYLSNDNTQTWSAKTPAGINLRYTNGLIIDPAGNIYIADNINEIFYRSTDKGETWTINDQYELNELKIDHRGNLYILDGYGFADLYISRDYGQSWEILTESEEYNDIFFGVDGEIILIDFWDKKAVISHDDVTTWKEINLDAEFDEHEFINDLIIYGQYIFYAGSYSGFWFSPDMGETWIQNNEGLEHPLGLSEDVDINDLFLLNGDLYLSGMTGIFRSTDLGETWEKFHDGMRDIVIGADFNYCSDERLYVTTIHGVYRSSDIIIGVEEDAGEPFDITLFPNPARDRCILKINDPEYMKAEVYLYDETGNKVRDYGKFSGGSMEIKTSGLTSGAYFMKIEIDGKSNTKPLMIIR